MGTEQLKRFKIVRGKKYNLYTTYPSKSKATEAAGILRSYGERAFVANTHDGYAVYHRDGYSDIRD